MADPESIESISEPPTPDWLVLGRTVRFGDTDAAGVMHFHQLLRWCHEAYEESLERFGIAAAEIFPTPGWITSAQPVAVPIVHCQADFYRPLVCGDSLLIELRPRYIDNHSFEIFYLGRHNSYTRTRKSDQVVATATTRHRAINVAIRKRCELPISIKNWLKASASHPET